MTCAECGGRGRINAAGRVGTDEAYRWTKDGRVVNTFDCAACLGVGDVYDPSCDCSFCENVRAATSEHIIIADDV